MIPKVLHFIFGLKKDFGGLPFSMINYVSLRSAFEVNYPCKIYFYYKYMPTGEWWERAKKFVTPIEVSVPRKIYGNKLYHYAHQTDVLRILILLKFGGIYLGIDTVCIKPFRPLLSFDCVMGKQLFINKKYGLCNAVILAQKIVNFYNYG